MNPLWLVLVAAGTSFDDKPLRPALEAGVEIGVETHVIEPQAVYTIKVSPDVAVHLHFPFVCYKAQAPADWMDARPVEDYPSDVLFLAKPNVSTGQVFKGGVICDQEVRLSFKFVVAPVEEVPQRIEFQWTPGELSAINNAVKAALDAKGQDCNVQLKLAEMSRTRSELESILLRAKDAFEQHTDRETARKGSVIVYVDREKRVGDVGIIEFRIQNREGGSVYVDQVEVANVGSNMPPHIVLVGDNTLVENATPQNDLLTAAALLPSPLLQPGTTVEGAVAFKWPSDTTRFDMTVRVRAPDPRAIVVQGIDF